MKIKTFDIDGPCLITPTVHGDDRGWFMETYRKDRFEELTGHVVEFVQDNHSMSAQVGTVRGLHYQSPPFAQAKLVRCLRGAIVDIIVDVRKSSPTYGQSIRVELDPDSKQQFFVPRGFLHGFATLKPDTEIAYKVDNYYSAECDGSVNFASPSLALDWGVDSSDWHLSEKDKKAPEFSHWDSPFD